MVDSQIGSDAVKPGSELGFRRVAFARAVDPQKDFLRQFFRQRLVMAHAVHKSNHGPVILVHQVFEGSIIITAGAKHDFSVTERIVGHLACCHFRISLYLTGKCGYEPSRF